MKRIFKLISIASTLTIISCATAQPPEQIEKWTGIKNSEEFKKEKTIYRQKLGKDICLTTGVDDFLNNSSIKPSKDCIYPASKFVVGREDDEAQYFKGNKVLKQGIKQLKVLQVTPTGFVVQLPRRSSDAVIFIHRTDETGIVDNTFLDETHSWYFYEYTGTYSYSTLVGSKTVHSFKKVSAEKFKNAQDGIKSYSPMREFYIENGLWSDLETSEKAKKTGKLEAEK